MNRSKKVKTLWRQSADSTPLREATARLHRRREALCIAAGHDVLGMTRWGVQQRADWLRSCRLETLEEGFREAVVQARAEYDKARQDLTEARKARNRELLPLKRWARKSGWPLAQEWLEAKGAA